MVGFTDFLFCKIPEKTASSEGIMHYMG
jgi:hypothetical protein